MMPWIKITKKYIKKNNMLPYRIFSLQKWGKFEDFYLFKWAHSGHKLYIKLDFYSSLCLYDHSACLDRGRISYLDLIFLGDKFKWKRWVFRGFSWFLDLFLGYETVWDFYYLQNQKSATISACIKMLFIHKSKASSLHCTPWEQWAHLQAHFLEKISLYDIEIIAF